MKTTGRLPAALAGGAGMLQLEAITSISFAKRPEAVRARKLQQHHQSQSPQSGLFNVLLVVIAIGVATTVLVGWYMQRELPVAQKRAKESESLLAPPSRSFCNRVRPPMVCAHGGDTTHAPPNTVSAFRAALAAGADCVEVDVARSRDGVLVVMHVRELAQLLGRSGMQVGDLPASELLALRWSSGEAVMSVEEAVLLTSPFVACVTLDVKTYNDKSGQPLDELEVAEALVGLVYKIRCTNCLIWAKSDRVVQRVLELSPGQRTGYIVMNETEESRQLGMQHPLRFSAPVPLQLQANTTTGGGPSSSPAPDQLFRAPAGQQGPQDQDGLFADAERTGFEPWEEAEGGQTGGRGYDQKQREERKEAPKGRRRWQGSPPAPSLLTAQQPRRRRRRLLLEEPVDPSSNLGQELDLELEYPRDLWDEWREKETWVDVGGGAREAQRQRRPQQHRQQQRQVAAAGGNGGSGGGSTGAGGQLPPSTTSPWGVMQPRPQPLMQPAVVGVHFGMVQPELLDLLHGAGKQLFAWTINQADVLRAVLDVGVDALVTNYPLTALAAIDARLAKCGAATTTPTGTPAEPRFTGSISGTVGDRTSPDGGGGGVREEGLQKRSTGEQGRGGRTGDYL